LIKDKDLFQRHVWVLVIEGGDDGRGIMRKWFGLGDAVSGRMVESENHSPQQPPQAPMLWTNQRLKCHRHGTNQRLKRHLKIEPYLGGAGRERVCSYGGSKSLLKIWVGSVRAFIAFKATEKDKIVHSLAWQRIAFAAMVENMKDEELEDAIRKRSCVYNMWV
ncbi:hypothetical protein Tco_1040535, partial [Tanacetum coccineum]